MNKPLVQQAELHIHETDLLSALWHSDGSGAIGIGSGIDGVSEDWQIRDVLLLDDGMVRIRIEVTDDALVDRS